MTVSNALGKILSLMTILKLKEDIPRESALFFSSFLLYVIKIIWFSVPRNPDQYDICNDQLLGRPKNLIVCIHKKPHSSELRDLFQNIII